MIPPVFSCVRRDKATALSFRSAPPPPPTTFKELLWMERGRWRRRIGQIRRPDEIKGAWRPPRDQGGDEHQRQGTHQQAHLNWRSQERQRNKNITQPRKAGAYGGAWSSTREAPCTGGTSALKGSSIPIYHGPRDLGLRPSAFLGVQPVAVIWMAAAPSHLLTAGTPFPRGPGWALPLQLPRRRWCILASVHCAENAQSQPQTTATPNDTH